ncbi:hypothetical protein BGZ72_008218 [Mortierella alpina]|nr:hypothetical protein BGZ72_008218 [Mortierella alpina]
MSNQIAAYSLPAEVLKLVSELIEGDKTETYIPRYKARHPFSLWPIDEQAVDDFNHDPRLESLRRHQNLIRTLTVKDSFASQYASAVEPVIVKNLRSLAVQFQPPPYRNVATEASVSARAFEVPQFLRSLELDNVQPHKIDSLLHSVIGFPNLRSLELSGMTLSGDSAQSLWRVFPQLESLILTEVLFLDLNEIHLQPKVYERLSGLTRIEDFEMCKHHSLFWGESGLKLRLEDGLGKLSAWKRLRRIYFLDDASLVVEQPEVAWMVDHWEDLELFAGRTDDNVLSADIFDARQIRFVAV